MHLNSPGGHAGEALFALADRILEMRATVPIVALVDEVATSAAHVLAAAAEHVAAVPSALVGSLAVLMPHVDVSGADAQAGHAWTLISSQPRKGDGWPHAPLSAAARATFQGIVDADHARLRRFVSRARNLPESAVDATQGRILRAEEALAAGLIDEISSAAGVVRQLVGGVASAAA